MYTTIETERKYLANRLYTLQNDKVAKASDHFNMDYYPSPKTGKELKEWFANGRVTLDPSLKDDAKFNGDYDFTNPHDYLVFVDPDKKRDPDSYNKVRSTIIADAVPVKDAINILPPTDGLKALQEFESKTYH